MKFNEIDLEDLLSDLPFNIETNSVPVRVWAKQRGLPIELRVEEYETIVRNNEGLVIPITRNAIWGKMETIKSFEKRKRHKTSNRWCKGSKESSRRSFECKKENGFVWIKLVSKWDSLDVRGRKMYFDEKYLRLGLKSNETGIWYISGEGQIRCLIIPRKLKLEDELLELIGILDGEVCKKINKVGGTALKISNTEPTVIKHIIDNFKKYFNIQEKDWNASITINAKNFNPTKEFDYELKKFWAKETRIPLTKITKTTITKKYLSKFSPKGVIQIRYSSTLFWYMLMHFLKEMRSIILSNKRYIIPYLRGLAAAEGGIGKENNDRKALKFVGIGGTKPEDREFYTKCLKKLGINSFREYNLRLEIYNTTNFLKLYEWYIFRLHPQRKRDFIIALSKLNKFQRYHPFATPKGTILTTLRDMPEP